jgi:hypothetical protein
LGIRIGIGHLHFLGAFFFFFSGFNGLAFYSGRKVSHTTLTLRILFSIFFLDGRGELGGVSVKSLSTTTTTLLWRFRDVLLVNWVGGRALRRRIT